ncbi:hypothetical protein PHSY_003691 [Pseudozyma hubeiensis SY62]|uniref:Uncharacterized protein n=1 Tax=Pseudozyma hubeiensis (strain SY62) TaxID=1305764 RepID=R9P420_PSEHS|nr:hypothetical protein PHSY_003691 [Pseudozyma hubeiensis SY62]GAC96111.1 hypothetical protein PHSY_003691 [Pseudozyma hubeiensis SY62]
MLWEKGLVEVDESWMQRQGVHPGRGHRGVVQNSQPIRDVVEVGFADVVAGLSVTSVPIDCWTCDPTSEPGQVASGQFCTDQRSIYGEPGTCAGLRTTASGNGAFRRDLRPSVRILTRGSREVGLDPRGDVNVDPRTEEIVGGESGDLQRFAGVPIEQGTCIRPCRSVVPSEPRKSVVVDGDVLFEQVQLSTSERRDLHQAPTRSAVESPTGNDGGIEIGFCFDVRHDHSRCIACRQLGEVAGRGGQDGCCGFVEQGAGGELTEIRGPTTDDVKIVSDFIGSVVGGVGEECDVGPTGGDNVLFRKGGLECRRGGGRGGRV